MSTQTFFRSAKTPVSVCDNSRSQRRSEVSFTFLRLQGDHHCAWPKLSEITSCREWDQKSSSTFLKFWWRFTDSFVGIRFNSGFRPFLRLLSNLQRSHSFGSTHRVEQKRFVASWGQILLLNLLLQGCQEINDARFLSSSSPFNWFYSVRTLASNTSQRSGKRGRKTIWNVHVARTGHALASASPGCVWSASYTWLPAILGLIPGRQGDLRPRAAHPLAWD